MDVLITRLDPIVGFWDFSDPDPPFRGGCKPCFDVSAKSRGTGPRSFGGAFDRQSCCVDCLCCGPGTVWTGSSCELAASDVTEVSCAEYESSAPDVGRTLVCKEAACCEAGTSLVAYPFDGDWAPACFCYPQFEPA
jgi:hypothetical protein